MEFANLGLPLAYVAERLLRMRDDGFGEAGCVALFDDE